MERGWQAGGRGQPSWTGIGGDTRFGIGFRSDEHWNSANECRQGGCRFHLPSSRRVCVVQLKRERIDLFEKQEGEKTLKRTDLEE